MRLKQLSSFYRAKKAKICFKCMLIQRKDSILNMDMRLWLMSRTANEKYDCANFVLILRIVLLKSRNNSNCIAYGVTQKKIAVSVKQQINQLFLFKTSAITI